MQSTDKKSKGPVISILTAIAAVILVLAGKEIPDFIQEQPTETAPAAVTQTQQLSEPETIAEPQQLSEPETIAEPQQLSESQPTTESQTSETVETTYKFRSKKLLNQHYEKHGIEMGFASAADYETAASAVINNPDALYKTEKEDGDGVYYVEATNEFVILSTDGYIRTYFNPSGGISYFNRQ
ncbi:MAG: hypothetical protein IJ716_11070 [Lachnospiraceae bacterium]|nr:hypothetical protein [Lachnospiraceae bacterium]